MKIVKIIRHSKLAAPYNDYSKLSFQQISDLATRETSPNIDPQTKEFVHEKLTEKELIDFELILCAPSKRAIQTAEVIKSLCKKKVSIRQMEELKEIEFNPKLLTTEQRYEDFGLSEIRSSLFEGLKKTSKGAEFLSHALARVDNFRKNLEKNNESNILCITHSFYMRILRLYFLENKRDARSISIEDLNNAIDHTYLEGFSIKL